MRRQESLSREMFRTLSFMAISVSVAAGALWVCATFFPTWLNIGLAAALVLWGAFGKAHDD